MTGMNTELIDSLKMLVGISSGPQYIFGFNLLSMSVTWNGSTGSRNMLLIEGFHKKVEKCCLGFGILCPVAFHMPEK